MEPEQDIWRVLADQSPNMIFINRRGAVVFANRRCEEVLGYAVDEICGEGFDFRRLVAPESLELVDRNFAAHMEGRDVPPYEYTLLARDGRRLEVINTTRAIQFEGQPAILGIVTDLTELRLARRALEESERRHRRLVELSPDAIVMTGLTGELLTANRRAAEMLGYEEVEQLLASRPTQQDLVPPEEADRLQRELLALIEQGGVRLFEIGLCTRGGAVVPAEAHCALVRDAAGRPAGFMGVIRDITARRLAERERRRIELQAHHARRLESLGLLAGGIAHDFNNWLVGMLGNASLALAELPEDSPAWPRVQQIELAATRAAELVDQLLAYSGSPQLCREEVDLGSLAAELAELMRVSASPRVALEVRCAPGLPRVRGDPPQLRQLVMNLLTNAVEALARGEGQVRVELDTATPETATPAAATPAAATPAAATPAAATPAGGWPRQGRLIRAPQAGRAYLRLRVADDGRGMDAETLERICDPFFTTKGPGRGLGLAAVLGIVRGHDGALAIDSARGRGSEVEVLLPAAERPAPRPQPPPPRRAAGGGAVLVVDDEVVVRQVARGMLENHGYEVLEAEGGAQALGLLEQHRGRLVLVLLDLTMPGMDGAEVLARLRETAPELPVLLSSGFTRQESAATLVEPGRTEFIQKPYRLQQLLATVRQLLGDC